MDIKQNIHDFENRWNCTCKFTTKSESFNAFRNRVRKALLNIPYDFISYAMDEQYLFIHGRDQHSQLKAIDPFVDDCMSSSAIYRDIINSKKMVDLIFTLQVLFWILEDDQVIPESIITEIAEAVRNAIAYSQFIDVELAIRSRTVTFYPAGARLLDDELVNRSLAWLADYPDIAKHFEQALKIYQEKDEKKFRNLLDNLKNFN